MPRERFPAPLFHWSHQIQDAIKKHVHLAISRLRPESYEQEPAYVAALIGRLDGIAYDGPDGKVEFIGTVVNDHGPGAAERKWGADFAITATLKQGDRTQHKAVLGQAKRGDIDLLPINERANLARQIRSMAKATRCCVTLETPSSKTLALGSPQIMMVGQQPFPTERIGFSDYLVDYLSTCRHGDKRIDFVMAASNSRLSGLHVYVEQGDEDGLF